MVHPVPASPLLIAHRGESRDAPENTLASVNLAWDRGARAVEIDVRLSADGVPVIIHDADTRRVEGPCRRVAAQTWAELRTIDAGGWKHRRWRGERIPSLREILDTIPAGGRMFVELKAGPECLAAVADVVRGSGFEPERLLFMSFDLETVRRLPGAFPGVEACLILTARQSRPGPAFDRAVAFAGRHGLGGLNFQANVGLRAETIAAAHTARLKAWCWTVNRTGTARRLALAGIDGITTDRCAWLRERLRAALG